MLLFVNPLCGELPTGEPYAGEPHVRFGGRGDRHQPVFPTPIKKIRHGVARWAGKLLPEGLRKVQQVCPD